MRLIDADALMFTDFEIVMCDGDFKQAFALLIDKIENVPTIDIVRCKECIHHDIFGRTTKYYGCKYYNMAVDADHFCKKGERRTDDETDEN